MLEPFCAVPVTATFFTSSTVWVQHIPRMSVCVQVQFWLIFWPKFTLNTCLFYFLKSRPVFILSWPPKFTRLETKTKSFPQMQPPKKIVNNNSHKKQMTFITNMRCHWCTCPSSLKVALYRHLMLGAGVSLKVKFERTTTLPGTACIQCGQNGVPLQWAVVLCSCGNR